MTIDLHKVVTVNYKLSNHQTGEKIEETTTENPMVFLFGVGSLIPDFENNLSGKSVGDKVSFSIEAAQAYGVRDNNQIVQIPINVFHDENGKFDESHVFVGALLPMSDSEGNHLRGQVVAIAADHVEMDFNHPLAGTDLKFDVEVVDIRPATADEIDHGHVHGPHGHHH